MAERGTGTRARPRTPEDRLIADIRSLLREYDDSREERPECLVPELDAVVEILRRDLRDYDDIKGGG